jgi:hypothetical protein
MSYTRHHLQYQEYNNSIVCVRITQMFRDYNIKQAPIPERIKINTHVLPGAVL